MAYIVASATKPDYKFETYEEAWEWAQFMRREGIIAAIVTSDDEALVVARGITSDYNLDTVQCN